MRFAVEVRGVAIGHSELEHADTGMGVAVGEFIPAAAYETVQPVFQRFADGESQSYYEARDVLALQLRGMDGKVLSTQWIHIADFERELGPGHAQLEVALKCIDDWRQYFDVRAKGN